MKGRLERNLKRKKPSNLLGESGDRRGTLKDIKMNLLGNSKLAGGARGSLGNLGSLKEPLKATLRGIPWQMACQEFLTK